MDRHRSGRPSDAGDQINGGDMPYDGDRPLSSCWSDEGGDDAANDHHRFPRSYVTSLNGGFNGGDGFHSGGGGGGFHSGGGGDRFHPYHDSSRGNGPRFCDGPTVGLGRSEGSLVGAVWTKCNAWT